MSQEKIVLVMVKNLKSSEKLIKEGYRLSSAQSSNIKVLCILNSNDSKIIEGTALKQLFATCKSLNLDMHVYWGESDINVALNYLKRNRVDQLILEEPEKMEKGGFAYEIHNAFPDIPMTIADK
jgi:K+-sensing histidine kinase KdpD